MVLIKLTGVPHPDLNDGLPQPVYIDASRVLLICQGHHEWPKIGSIERHRELYDRLYRASTALAEKTQAYVPDMTDPVAVAWMRTAQVTAQAVSDAYRAWGGSYNHEDSHPRIDCTEVQLACGTALEHGVMLTRVWVSESPEEVYAKVEEAQRPWRNVPGPVGL